MSTFASVSDDLRIACRGLQRARGGSLAGGLRLASGAAGPAVMFALLHGVLLRPLSVHEPERLSVAWTELRTSGSARCPFGTTEIDSVAEASLLLEKAAGVTRH